MSFIDVQAVDYPPLLPRNKKEHPAACNQYRKPMLLCTGHKTCFEVRGHIYPLPEKKTKKNSINKSVTTTEKHTKRQKCEPDYQSRALKTGILTFPAIKSVLKNLSRVEVSNPLPY